MQKHWRREESIRIRKKLEKSTKFMRMRNECTQGMSGDVLPNPLVASEGRQLHNFSHTSLQHCCERLDPVYHQEIRLNKGIRLVLTATMLILYSKCIWKYQIRFQLKIGISTGTTIIIIISYFKKNSLVL